LPPSHDEAARAHYLDEGTPFRSSGRVDMPHAYVDPEVPGDGGGVTDSGVV